MKGPSDLNYLIDTHIHSESFFSGIVGRFVFNVTDRRIFGDDTFYRSFGIKGSSVGVVVDELNDRVHPDDLEKASDIQTAALANRQGYSVEYRILNAEGRYRWFLSKSKPQIIGDSLYYIGVITDVDDHRRQKETLEKQQQLMNIIVANATAALFLVDAGGCCTFMNLAAKEITGFTFEEITRQPLHYMIHYKRPGGDFLPMHECTVARATQEGFELRDHEDVFLRKDGSFFPAMCAVTPVYQNGVLTFSVIEMHDLSKQKKIEAQAERSIRHLETINNVGASITADLDLQAILQKVTDATTSLSGAEFGAFFYNSLNTSGEAYMLYTLSGAPRELFEQLGMPRKTSVFRSTFDGTGVVRSGDITKDPRYAKNPPLSGMPAGHLPVVSYLAVPVVSKSGTVIGGLLFGHSKPDVFTADTEELVIGVAAQAAVAIDNARLYETIKEANFRKETQLAVAEELNEKKDQFISIASHELKTPLTSIMAYVQLIERGINNKQYDNLPAYVEKTTLGLHKFKNLINDLLDVSRIDANKLQFKMERLDIGQLIESCAESCSVFVGPHKLIVKDVAKGLYVYANKERIEQVLLNLITNAVKYSPGKDEVHISAACNDKEVTVTVHDFGIGIPQEKLEYVFEKFFRVDEHSGQIPGLGIGLYISREIVERHGGSIGAQSSVGEGSRFFFKLPLSNATFA